jgi:hypothetical protein
MPKDTFHSYTQQNTSLEQHLTIEGMNKYSRREGYRCSWWDRRKGVRLMEEE